MGLTFELIIFIASILFGILWYWRESNGNGLYRFFNKILNSKELQMKSTEKRVLFINNHYSYVLFLLRSYFY